MNWIPYNPNKKRKTGDVIGDCVVRMLSKVLGHDDWDEAYCTICAQGFEMGNMPSANEVWITYLQEHGYEEHPLVYRCKNCYTLDTFCEEHKDGKSYVLWDGTHTVFV